MVTRIDAVHLTCICVAVFTLLIGCGKQPATKLDNDRKVIIGYLPISAHLPGAVAEEIQAFEDLRVDVEFRVYSTSNALLSAVSSGEVDAATTVAVSPVAGRIYAELEQGLDPSIQIVSFSRTTQKQPFDSVFVAPDSAIHDLEQLAGKRVAVFPGTTAQSILSYYLKEKHGIHEDAVHYHMLPPTVQVARLRDGDVDALFTYETVRTAAEFGGMRQIHGSVIASVLEGAPYGCSVVNSSFARQKEQVAQAFVEALDRGILAIRQDEALARQVLQNRLGESSEIASLCNLEFRHTSEEIRGEQQLRVLREFLAILVDAGDLKGMVTVESMLWKMSN